MERLLISSDKAKLDVDFVYDYLSNSYWAKGRSRAAVEKSIEHSICYGVYLGSHQIGFARVISDRVVFAYIMDLFITDKEQGQGFGSKLVEAILSDSINSDIKKWYLRTRDAHELYAKFGFTPLANPELSMERWEETIK